MIGPPAPIRLDGIVFFNDRQEHEFVRKAERRAHEMVADKLIGGEWFTISTDEAQAVAAGALDEAKAT
jgi:hypothetical protein